jgi:hypothetical protein
MSVEPRPPNTCWKCHQTYPPGTKICVACGIDLETGEDLSFKNQDTVDPDEIDPYRPKNAFEWLTMSLPGLFRPMVLVGFIGMAFIFAALGFLTLLLLEYQVIMSAMAVGAVGLLAWAQGVIFLLLGRFSILHDGLSELRGSQWHIFILLTLAPIGVFMLVLKLLMPEGPGMM